MQIRIRTLVFAIVVVAIGLGSLRHPSPAAASVLFTLALGLPLAAIVKAVACRGMDRLPWIGFSLFGLVFLRGSFNSPASDVTPTSNFTAPDSVVAVILGELSRYINPDVHAYDEQVRTPPSGPLIAASSRRAAYFNCCASLGSLIMALIGGLLGRWISIRPQVRPARNCDEAEVLAPGGPSRVQS
jgi:hypothetical protein